MRAALALGLAFLALAGCCSCSSPEPFKVVWNSWYPTQCKQFGDQTSEADFRAFGIQTNNATAFNGNVISLFCAAPSLSHRISFCSCC